MYTCEVYSRMLDSDPFAPLEEITQQLSKSLHKPATNAFPHKTTDMSKPGRIMHNSLYVEELLES